MDKLVVKNINKVFENGDGIRDISFKVKKGEFVTLLGPSGCGKTTILRAIGGFNQIDSGSIALDNQEIHHIKPENRPTSMVFQSYNLWPHMNIYRNLAFGLKIRKMKKKDMDKKIKDTLDMLHIRDQIKKYPKQLSGGQKQRVAIARSLVLEPSVLLLDEPFSALDAKIRKEMRKEIKRIQLETGITIVFVTHDQEEAMGLSDRIIVMNKGTIEQIGTPNEVYENPSTYFVANFMGEMNFLQVNGQRIGFRPEDIVIEEQGMYRATIIASTLVGHYVSVDCMIHDEKVVLYVSKELSTVCQKGNEIGFSVTNEHVYAS
ncbi:ABC transporter ATP-binding protein [Vallitalea pronyensis]|uniref:ABC transporter ATP-binding protein n=1 Tax=Vallitalea pronyensis TaxID=1348613 RepID=A0A8J8SJ99_9FIRM|nr:ABC transporter ATP-binding protein [Vallitalea pronyensis]QUI25348.1 ABC transporter ATP-binding protein [Vallitalea pronyensis]